MLFQTIYFLFIYLFIRERESIPVQMWRSKGIFQEWILSFQLSVGYGGGTRSSGLAWSPFLMNRLTGLQKLFELSTLVVL